MKLRYLFFAAAASTLAAACSEVDELASNALGEKKLETIHPVPIVLLHVSVWIVSGSKGMPSECICWMRKLIIFETLP